MKSTAFLALTICLTIWSNSTIQGELTNHALTWEGKPESIPAQGPYPTDKIPLKPKNSSQPNTPQDPIAKSYPTSGPFRQFILNRNSIHSEPVRVPEPFNCKIVTFFNKHNSPLVKSWIDYLPLREAHNHQVGFVNIIFPGGLFFMIPRRQALKKIKKQVDQAMEGAISTLNPEDQSLVRDLNLHWIADFSRFHFKQLELDSKKMHVLLVDQKGQVLAKETGFHEASASKLREFLLKSLKTNGTCVKKDH